MNRVLLAFVFFLLPFSLLLAGEVQITTADGQTLQGEHLGTKDGVVKLKTKYGPVSIAEKDIVTITAIKSTEKEPPPVGPPVEKKPPEGEAAPKSFVQPKGLNVNALAAQALAAKPPAEPNKEQRQEIMRLVRNFGESSSVSRQRILRGLQQYGMMALPFITPAYVQPWEVEDRVALFEGLAVPGQFLTAGAFAQLHNETRSAMDTTAAEPPPPPPDYVSQHDRLRPRTKAEWLKLAAGNVLRVEGYASTAGGPYNALLLLDIYKKRYASDKEDVLLVNASRDRDRLAAAANNATSSRSGWTGADRIVLAEQVFPLLFKDNPDLQSIAQAFLKKILPSGYPKWDAPQADWVEWWMKAKESLEKK